MASNESGVVEHGDLRFFCLLSSEHFIHVWPQDSFQVMRLFIDSLTLAIFQGH